MATQPFISSRRWHTYAGSVPTRAPNAAYPPHARIKKRPTSHCLTVLLPAQFNFIEISLYIDPEESRYRSADLLYDGQIITTVILPEHVTEQHVLYKRTDSLEVIWYEKVFWEQSGGLSACEKDFYEWGSVYDEGDEKLVMLCDEDLKKVDRSKIVPEMVEVRMRRMSKEQREEYQKRKREEFERRKEEVGLMTGGLESGQVNRQGNTKRNPKKNKPKVVKK